MLSPCNDGQWSRPPEFIRSVERYDAFLKIVMNPDHPQHEEMLEAAEKDTYFAGSSIQSTFTKELPIKRLITILV
ncbi:IS1096 element passenger TnpR family protein [Bacillus solitudinis]|uniref:IS1096 element passenger TnpR family protein n=1 Tax=Bacillus solitudinis TaxID=2014074 RepID=UPI000C247D67|nr:hypothetical protein [Bacillus solitudinis]